tara:strand:+ start:5989 stop:6159 length:171 start_codon:yes stop_codon:yes gene_type:complete
MTRLFLFEIFKKPNKNMRVLSHDKLPGKAFLRGRKILQCIQFMWNCSAGLTPEARK